MLEAVIAAILAAIAAVALIVGVFLLVRKRRSSSMGAHRASRKPVNTVEGVGIFESQSLNNVQQMAASQHMAPDESGTKKPAAGLRDRFLIMGAFATAVFGALLAKLFSLQVVRHDDFATAADENATTTVKTLAPRGFILDRNRVEMVRNRSSLTVLADADVADDRDVLTRLSTVLGLPYNIVRHRIQDTTGGAQSQRVVAQDVRLRDIAYISEHASAFPGVTIQSRSVREYPYDALAAHVLGYTNVVSQEDLDSVEAGRDLEMGDMVGKSGVEAMYENVLAGDHGKRVVVTDAQGRVREVVSEVAPKKGNDVVLTIDARIQYYIDARLAQLIAPDKGTLGSGVGTGGAAVVMDVRDGSIIAMSSYPTYSPGRFVGGISQEVYEIYNNENEQNAPLMNRAISGRYPAASTYKAFTGMAALTRGITDEKREFLCEGAWDGFQSGDWQLCWLHSGHGLMHLREGVVESCDVVFYNIAKDFFDNRGVLGEEALQDEIRKYNFGLATGIDLEGEATGRIPTPEWKAELNRDTPEAAVWRGGDMTNMIIGQGDVLVTPIQVAVAYAAIATGNLVKPHVFKEVLSEEGESVVGYEPEVVGHPDVEPEVLNFMRDALHGVATENESVAKLFAQYGIDAAAKTGTGEVAGKEDYAWFTCYAPYTDPKYVVALVIEQGGGGSSTAAPIGVDIMAMTLWADEGVLQQEIGTIAGANGNWKEYNPSGSERTD